MSWDLLLAVARRLGIPFAHSESRADKLGKGQSTLVAFLVLHMTK